MLRTIVGIVAGFGILTAAANADALTLKIGTVAPPGSAWAVQFDKMASDVKTATNGEVEMQFVYSQSDEPSIVKAARDGKELQGGAVTAAGLASINPDVLVFQMPGLWGDDVDAGWAKLERARKAVRPQLDASFEKGGFTCLGWGDVGVARIMGINTEIKGPSTLQGQKTYTLNGDNIGPVFISQLGMSTRQMSLGEATTHITSTKSLVFEAPPLAAVSLGWSNAVTHVNTMPVSYLIGAIIVNTSQISGLSDDAQKTLRTGGDAAGASLTKRIRKADNAAWSVLKAKKQVYEPTDAEKAEWRKTFANIRQQLRGKTFSADIFDKVSGYAK